MYKKQQLWVSAVEEDIDQAYKAAYVSPYTLQFRLLEGGRALGRRWDVNPSTQRLTRTEERRKEGVQREGGRGKGVAGGKAKRREGSKGEGGCVQVLTINTPGPDEEERRRLGEEICISHDVEPQGAGCLRSLPATLSLPFPWRCLQAWYFAWFAEFPPSPTLLKSHALRHHRFSRRGVRVRLILNPCLTRSVITLGIIRWGWMIDGVGEQGMRWRNKSH